MKDMHMTLLQNGQILPSFDVPAIGGGAIKLPEALAGAFGVVLIYRGAWCPYCNAQLSAFGRAADRLADAGIKVVAFSADDETTAAVLVAKHGLSFPVGHSADVDSVVAATGAYSSAERRYLQTTGFVLAPSGAVINAVYSSAAIGRLVPDDVIGLVNYAKAHA